MPPFERLLHTRKSELGPNAIQVLSEDIREKERVGKTSAVVLFVVDASGSMGAMQRMEGAKGAVLSMLMDSYQKRDKIGMIAFKGKEAELILPPCSSVDLAMSCLRELTHRRQDASFRRPLQGTSAFARRAPKG